MPSWYSQDNFGEPSSFDNYDKDAAMGRVSTPSGTQYTPQEDTSDEQDFLGDLHTPSQSIEDGVSNTGPMTEFLMSDLVSPRAANRMAAVFATSIDEEEPNNLYSTPDHLGFDEVNADTHARDSILRSARPSARGAPQAVAYTQRAWHIGEKTYLNDGGFQAWGPEYWAAGADSPEGQREERNYTWGLDETSTPVTPRYIPGSRTAPWSTFEMDDSQIDKQPSPDQALFALDSDANTSAAGFSAPFFRPSLVDQPTHPMSPPNVLQPAAYPESDDSDDTIDRPPPDNPVGPPPNFVTREAGRRYLNPDQKANAARMRMIGNCWNCALLKYPCDPGVKCNRCGRMRKTSAIWECDRTYLPDLTCVFIPDSLLSQHEPDNLRAFCRKQVRRWTDNCLTVYLTWGYGKAIKCKVNEIEPIGDGLLFQNQYRLNLTTTRYDRCKVPSPPLGIMLLEVGLWRQRLDRYLDNLLQAEFGGFPSTCFRGRECQVQRDLLHPMHAYYVEFKDAPLPRLCLKLVVVTHIMSHSLTLTEDTRLAVSSRLRNPPNAPYEPLTCPRWLNKELKFLLATLHTNLLKNILGLLHKNLRDCRDKRSLWVIAFISLLSLSMVTESMQVSVLCKEETDKENKTIPQDNTQAESDVSRMDEKLDLLIRIFRKKYGIAENRIGKGFNPLRESDDRDSLDQHARTFAVEVGQIIQSYRRFLQIQRALEGPPTTPNEPRTSRLVAKFLLSV